MPYSSCEMLNTNLHSCSFNKYKLKIETNCFHFLSVLNVMGLVCAKKNLNFSNLGKTFYFMCVYVYIYIYIYICIHCKKNMN